MFDFTKRNKEIRKIKRKMKPTLITIFETEMASINSRFDQVMREYSGTKTPVLGYYSHFSSIMPFMVWKF